jgi:5-methylcytosine-specific restriction endonuclease McrA
VQKARWRLASARYRAKHRPKVLAKQRDYNQRYYAKNREKLIAASAAYYAANREQILADNKTPEARRYQALWKRAFRASNPVAYNAYTQKRRDANRETIRERDRAYYAIDYAAHPERHRAKHHRRRARIAGSQRNDLTPEQAALILALADGVCAYCPYYNPTCQACKRHSHELTYDHITPVNDQGDSTLWNFVACCKSCNSKKGIGPPPGPVQPLLL